MELFSLRKRINQKTFFVGYAFYALLAVGFVVVSTLNSKNGTEEVISKPLAAAQLVYLLAIVLFDLCLTKQRANDISGSRSIWYFALGALLPGFIIGVFPSEKAANRFGPVPEPGVHFD
jgi:uncharacterized membrane protein YhaH (DUF805 family)